MVGFRSDLMKVNLGVGHTVAQLDDADTGMVTSFETMTDSVICGYYKERQRCSGTPAECRSCLRVQKVRSAPGHNFCKKEYSPPRP